MYDNKIELYYTVDTTIKYYHLFIQKIVFK